MSIALLDDPDFREAVPKAAGIVVLVYLVLAPIYWLPGISASVISLLKAGAFLTAAGAAVTVLALRRKIASSFRLLAPWGVLLLLGSTVGLAQSELAGIFSLGIDYALIFLALVIGISLTFSAHDEIVRRYTVTMVVVAVAAMIVSVIGPTLEGGFAYKRTGWSDSVAFAALIALVLMVSSKSAKAAAAWALAYLLIAITQLYFAGRSGFLAPIVAFGVCFLIGQFRVRIRPRYLAAGAALLVLAAGIAIPRTLDHLRISTVQSKEYINVYDHILSGRLTLATTAFREFRKKPIRGHGFGNMAESAEWNAALPHPQQRGMAVHNEWLKYLYQGGIFHFAAMVAFFAYLTRECFLADRRAVADGAPPIFLAVMISGLATSMVEPNHLIGVFQKSAPLWVFIGMAVGLNRLRSRQSV